MSSARGGAAGLFLSAIRDEVDRVKSQGMSRQDFIDTLTPKAANARMVEEKRLWVDKARGRPKPLQLGSARRLATIYNVNNPRSL